MSEELKPDPKQAVGQEAELAAQSMVEGKEEMQEVDVDADYEASKEYSVSDVDKTGAGAAAATAATAPEHELSEVKDREVISEPTADPDDYREMAKEVNPRANQ